MRSGWIRIIHFYFAHFYEDVCMRITEISGISEVKVNIFSDWRMYNYD